jgi:hypothetical protein
MHPRGDKTKVSMHNSTPLVKLKCYGDNTKEDVDPYFNGEHLCLGEYSHLWMAPSTLD